MVTANPERRAAAKSRARAASPAVVQAAPNSAGPLLPPRALRQQRRPLHDVVFEVGIGNLGLGALNAAAHGDAGFVHRVRIAGDQRMPPVEIAAFGDEAIAAARR